MGGVILNVHLSLLFLPPTLLARVLNPSVCSPRAGQTQINLGIKTKTLLYSFSYSSKEHNQTNMNHLLILLLKVTFFVNYSGASLQFK